MEVENEFNDSQAADDKTFINKLLVEMKTQFNKPDKKLAASIAKDVTEMDVVNESSTDEVDKELCSLNKRETKTNILEPALNVKSESETCESDVTESSSGDSHSISDNVNASEQYQDRIELKEEKQDVSYEEAVGTDDLDQAVKSENDNQDDSDDKPRIVLTFRKPSVSSPPFKSTTKSPDDSATLGRRSLRTKPGSSEETGLKRSTRRRSRDCNESVLQSAIARKEKSYNEANRPQRLTRQLKPTPKILENLATMKLERNRSDKSKSHKNTERQKVTDNDSSDNDTTMTNFEESVNETENDRSHKRHKHLTSNNCVKNNHKRLKTSQCDSSKDSDSDHSSVHDIKESDFILNALDNKITSKPNKNNLLDEKSCRRSHRISSKMKEEKEVSNLDDASTPEPNSGEQQSLYPSDPVCSSVGAQLIASRLCLCTHKTQFYVATTKDDVVYCTAVDNIGDRLVGCNNIVHTFEVSMLRPSSRVPYVILCDVHLNRMLRHNCCPTCGLFCTQGKFTQCKAKHQYHRDCQISVGDMQCCPHCGLPTPEHDVFIKMHSTKTPVFLPVQKLLHASAKMGFQQNMKLSNQSERQAISPPLIPVDAIDLPEIADCESAENYTVDDIIETIKNEDYEKLAIMLATHSVLLTHQLEECNGGTLLHYAAQNGYLTAVHMLLMAGCELDIFNKDQNTSLVLAVTAYKNDTVKYLLKAGASFVLKGTDGMTALHLAAKCGNLDACEMLLNTAVVIRDYVNTADDGGWTPLVWACEHGHAEVATFLLRKGADPLLRDVEHNIALHWAAFSGSSRIAEMLLNSGSDVNVVNAHGDMPLHIGARQDMYNCVLLLLARGANVNAVNKSGETALDCAPESGDSYTVISLNLQFQSLTACPAKSLRTILTNDISRGRESNPIQCVNLVDDEPKPTDFTYISKNCITSDDVQIDEKITTLQSCTCDDKCTAISCLCCNNSLRCWYDEEGKLMADFNYTDPPIIFECNEVCGCNAITCSNRVVQHGLTQRFQLFKTETKGWGIRTLRNIPKGSYVCEYVGEIISDVEADQREDDSYLFDLDNRVYMMPKENESYCIDAKHFGNFARFINHSCEPNLLPIRVFINHQDLRFPRIGFFASRDILAEEELSFDYGEKFWIVKCKSFACDCNSESCKYSKNAMETTVENYNSRICEEL